jgi:hypothetical protein
MVNANVSGHFWIGDMTFKSVDSYRDFALTVRRGYRYARTPDQQEFLKSLAATSHSRSLTMKAGYVLWRAQLGHDWRKIEQEGIDDEEPTAFPTVRMKPIAEKAADGRVNPKGIPCLYLATKKDTAALEVRPLIGSYVSIAQFQIVKDLKIVNCSAREIGDLAFLDKNLSQDDIEKVVWSAINRACSEPVERSDESLDYVPTQIIAETFRLNGFDGIAYKSSYGEDGFNVALFDLAAADLINRCLYRIKNMSVELSEQENPYFVKSHYEMRDTPSPPNTD